MCGEAAGAYCLESLCSTGPSVLDCLQWRSERDGNTAAREHCAGLQTGRQGGPAQDPCTCTCPAPTTPRHASAPPTLMLCALRHAALPQDTNKTVADVVKEAVATIGENIQIRRFAK